MTTYIDMDGVLVDLRGQFRSDAELISAVPSMSRKDWANLPKTRACDWWIKQFDRPIILTRCTTLAASQGKIDWKMQWLPSSWKMIQVPGSKAGFAKHGATLYDDYMRNVLDWFVAGGTSILCDTTTGYPTGTIFAAGSRP